MSWMRCFHCDAPVNTDDQPETLYIIDGECVCWDCEPELITEWLDEPVRADMTDLAKL